MSDAIDGGARCAELHLPASPREVADYPFSRQWVACWLAKDDPEEVGRLLALADEVRALYVGDQVHLRALIEISNHCRRSCYYCGLREPNAKLVRYRLSQEQVLSIVDGAVSLGYRTMVLQSGEDPELDVAWVEDLILRIKARHDVAITLGLGERSVEELRRWREAGADRYLLKQETVSSELYGALHPDMKLDDRLAQLRAMKDMGYQVGSGAIVGLPGQTWEALADDLLFMRSLDMDMVGCGPLIVHPATPLADRKPGEGNWRVLPSVENTLKVTAVARLLLPEAMIPVTTALATIDKDQGREKALQAGANVVMPDVTPVDYRAKYEIYPGKACLGEGPDACRGCLHGRIASIGRTVATDKGHRPRVPKI